MWISCLVRKNRYSEDKYIFSCRNFGQDLFRWLSVSFPSWDFTTLTVHFSLFLISVCQARMDLGFVVEASASVEKHGKGNFKRMLDFVEWTVRKFSISSTKTRVGLVTFGAKTDLVFNFERLVFRKNWFTVYLCFMFNICVIWCQFYLLLFGPLWRRHGCFIFNLTFMVHHGKFQGCRIRRDILHGHPSL